MHRNELAEHEKHHEKHHEHHEKHEEVTIFINTREFKLHQKTLTYQELVDLAYPGNVPNPNMIYEITYSSEHGPDGKVGVGGDVKLEEGMVCNVGITNRS